MQIDSLLCVFLLLFIYCRLGSRCSNRFH